MAGLDSLSDQQKTVVNQDGVFVVKACPGSGKTYSVAARIARLLVDDRFDFSRKGIAALSFTNVAWQEIEMKLKEDFNVKTPLGFPHFIGTIDSFLNQYVFLPFGHLMMGCDGRPDLVGDPYSFWADCDYSLRKRYKDKKTGALKIGSRDPLEFFDKVSFNKNDEPIPTYNPDFFNFRWKKTRKKDGSYIQVVQDIIDAKWAKFKHGKATQNDANYFAYKILSKYKRIALSITARFSHFMVDEAQDTNENQMAILDMLKENGAIELSLIGDPDQAIFEWNDAKPELFINKYMVEGWKKLELKENRRSSKLICDCSRALLDTSEYEAIGKDKNYDYAPCLRTHNEEQTSVQKILREFLESCKDRKVAITPENVAVLFRGYSVGAWFGIAGNDEAESPWLQGQISTREVVQGKYLMESGDFRKGFKNIERGYLKATDPNLRFCSEEYINKKVEQMGFKDYRIMVSQFINLLPPTHEVILKDWIDRTNQILQNNGIKVKLSTHPKKSSVKIKDLFRADRKLSNTEYFIGTIHSAKGKTFEAVLLVLAHKAGISNYKTILFPKSSLTPKQAEELRTVYVAMTRPRKILWIAVPETDREQWKKKLWPAQAHRTEQLSLFSPTS